MSKAKMYGMYAPYQSNKNGGQRMRWQRQQAKQQAVRATSGFAAILQNKLEGKNGKM